MAKVAINLKTGQAENTTRSKDVIVGIDLGTTNSLIAYVKDGDPTVIRDSDGLYALVPSVIHFDEHDEVIVGQAAVDRLKTSPERTIYSAKRLMGKSYGDVSQLQQRIGYTIVDEDQDSLVKVRVGDRFYTPIELSAHILKALKSRAEQQLGSEVSRAVITVPAYFNDAQRQATRDAGKLAGLDVLRIVNEPTAASLAYGIGLSDSQDQTVAVYDLGGGTFDISILQIAQGTFEVLSTSGDTYLGGDDFDNAIVTYWQQQHAWSEDYIKQRSQYLRLAAESAKRTLSDSDIYTGAVDGVQLELERVTFEGLIQPLVRKTILACAAALQDAELTTDHVDRVVMVGGSTRVPYVRQQVSDYFGQPVYDDINPDEVVALGAAIQADVLAGNRTDVLLLDITPLSLGIETVGGLMDTIINRNTKVPAKAGRQYTTSVDGQVKLKVAVYQGERDLVAHNRKLGEFVLSDIPPMAAGLPKIDIQFILDADGILKVRARELRSNREQVVQLRPQYGITEEEMGRMLLESLQHAEQDLATRALLEARNEADNILLSAGRFVEQNESWLGEAQVDRINSLAEALLAARNGDDKDAINAAMQEMNDYTTPLAHEALDRNVKAAITGDKL